MANQGMGSRRPRYITRKYSSESDGVCSSYAELSSFPKIPTARKVIVRPKLWRPGLYPVEAIPVDDDYVRVHFIGWDSKYDETRKKEEVVTVSCPIQNRPELNVLKLHIKEYLSPSQNNDSKIIIRQPMEENVYEVLKQIGIIYKVTKTKTVYRLSGRTRADQLFGCGWDYRIVNKNGDNFYVKTDTVRFYMHKRKAINDYIAYPDHVEENYTERGKQLVFSFIKVPGNLKTLKHLLNNDVL